MATFLAKLSFQKNKAPLEKGAVKKYMRVKSFIAVRRQRGFALPANCRYAGAATVRLPGPC